jgi:hypothetical protein
MLSFAGIGNFIFFPIKKTARSIADLLIAVRPELVLNCPVADFRDVDSEKISPLNKLLVRRRDLRDGFVKFERRTSFVVLGQC